jgi:hypothetical protein
MKFGNRHIFRFAWSLARSGARRFGGRASEFFRASLKIAYDESPAGVSGRPSAIKPLNRISHTMRIAIPVITLAILIAIAPVTHASIGFLILVNFPIYLAAHATAIIWRITAPSKVQAIR